MAILKHSSPATAAVLKALIAGTVSRPYRLPSAEADARAAISDELPASVLKAEVEALPGTQRLVDNGGYHVYWTRAGQAPCVLQEIGRLFGRPPAGLTREGRDALLKYHWPGNVRELRNVLERAAILCEGGLITAEHFSLNREPPSSASQAGASTTTDLNVVEREMIAKTLANCKGNKSKAAAQLGISRTQLYVRLRKYQLS